MGFSNGQPVTGSWNHDWYSLSSWLRGHQQYILKDSFMRVWLERVSDGVGIAVYLEGTPIVTHWPNWFELNNGGWWTRITKERMCEFLPDGFSVYQHKWFWHLSYNIGSEWVDFPYANGMTVTIDPVVVSGQRDKPRWKTVAGTRVPALTIEEYTERALATLAWWMYQHDGYFTGGNLGWRRKYKHQVRVVTSVIRGVIDEFKSAESGIDFFTSVLEVNNTLHVSPGWMSDGRILVDYGKGRGLPYTVVDTVSNYPDEYFGEDEIERFYALEKDELPNIGILESPYMEIGYVDA